jgi:hypothetical protein
VETRTVAASRAARRFPQITEDSFPAPAGGPYFGAVRVLKPKLKLILGDWRKGEHRQGTDPAESTVLCPFPPKATVPCPIQGDRPPSGD